MTCTASTPMANELAFQRRDGALIRMTYDALNRRLTKAPAGEATITYGYDYTGRPLSVQSSADSAGLSVQL